MHICTSYSFQQWSVWFSNTNHLCILISSGYILFQINLFSSRLRITEKCMRIVGIITWTIGFIDEYAIDINCYHLSIFSLYYLEFDNTCSSNVFALETMLISIECLFFLKKYMYFPADSWYQLIYEECTVKILSFVYSLSFCGVCVCLCVWLCVPSSVEILFIYLKKMNNCIQNTKQIHTATVLIFLTQNINKYE